MMKTRAKLFTGLAATELLIIALISCSTEKGAMISASLPDPVASSSSATAPGSSSVPLLTGNGLAEWHPEGAAAWQAENGQLEGTTNSDTGGWLFLNEGYQDFVLHALFQCTTCDAGVLLRAEGSGTKLYGIYIPLGSSKMGKMYRVALASVDSAPTDLTPMPAAPPLPGSEGSIDKGSCDPISCDGILDAHGGSNFPSAATPKPIRLHSGWNQLDVTMRGDVILASVNDTTLTPAVMDNAPRYGQIALRTAGSTGNLVRFKDISIKDLTLRTAGEDASYTSPDFRRDQLTHFFYSEAIAAGDISHNSTTDVVSGPFIYQGRDYKVARELFPPVTYNVGGPQDGYTPKSKTGLPQAGTIVHGNYTSVFLSWVYDFQHNGWPDVLDIMGFGPRPTFSLHLFINPHNQKRHWGNYQIFPIISNEYDVFLPKGIGGTGTPALVVQTGNKSDWSDAQVGYLEPSPDITKPWTFVPVSEPGHWNGHGMGVGDILGNGRLDILNRNGWWEQPPKGTPGLWKFHPQVFGSTESTSLAPGMASSCFACGGAKMKVYDVNGDGLPDVITSLNAHGPGLAWYEQQRDSQGNVSWKQHLIMGSPLIPLSDRGSWEETDKKVAFTELHALDYADMNGDGLMDIITGKRYWSHGFRYEENDIDDPPVLYWFELQRLPGPGHKVEWIPHLIDNSSGVGTSMLVTDINGDGRPDVLTASRMGTFVFFNNIIQKSPGNRIRESGD